MLRSRPLLAACAIGVLALGACSDEPGGDPERFCSEVADNADALTAPDFTAADDPDAAIDDLIEEYERIGQFAPLAIEEEWNNLTAAYQMADDVIAGEPESEQAALEAIYRAEGSAVAVAEWLATNCGVDIGPVRTIVPEVTTTVDPATTEAP